MKAKFKKLAANTGFALESIPTCRDVVTQTNRGRLLKLGTFVLLFKFYSGRQFCASKSRTNANRKSLVAIVVIQKKHYNIKND